MLFSSSFAVTCINAGRRFASRAAAPLATAAAAAASPSGKVVIECEYKFLGGTITENTLRQTKSTNSQSTSESWNRSVNLNTTVTSLGIPVKVGAGVTGAWGGSMEDASSEMYDTINKQQDTHISPEGHGFLIRTVTRKTLYDVTKEHFGYDIVHKEKTFLKMFTLEDGMKRDLKEDAIDYMKTKFRVVELDVPSIEFTFKPQYEDWQDLRIKFPNKSKWYLRTFNRKNFYCYISLYDNPGWIKSEKCQSNGQPPNPKQSLFQINWEGEGEDSFVYLTSGGSGNGLEGRYVYMTNTPKGYCEAKEGLSKNDKYKWIITKVPAREDCYFLTPKEWEGRSWAYIDEKPAGRMRHSGTQPGHEGWFQFVKPSTEDDP